MSAWGNSFGPCSGGGGETVIVEAIREASVTSSFSATTTAPQLAAEVIAASTASVNSIALSATVTSTTEADL